ncbi:pectin methylesterase-like acyl-CoA thioesterase [Sphingomonas zeicaulis]|uniref:pectinesterase family protein n=1 Tax=Sphingomonas zeicaulis TaxID=1632740 RepID=UPI003D2540EA
MIRMRWLAALLLLCCGVTAAHAETVRVSPTAHGAHRSVGAAIEALPPMGGTVRIDPGTYREKLWITKPNVHLVGTGDTPEAVELVYGDSSINVGNTYATPSVYVAANGFRADNLTISNDWSRDPAHPNAQAVALAVSGDRAVFTRVRILSTQDTLYLVHPQNEVARHVFRDCYVEGHVDFVFGNAKAYFERCQLHGLKRDNVFYTAQSRNSPDEDSAFVFKDCRLTAETDSGIFLGRAWRPYARVIWLDTRMDAAVDPAGWREWYPDRSKTLDTAYYAEYRSTGPGASPATRDRRSHQFTEAEAAGWTLEAFFKGDVGWIEAE